MAGRASSWPGLGGNQTFDVTAVSDRLWSTAASLTGVDLRIATQPPSPPRWQR